MLRNQTAPPDACRAELARQAPIRIRQLRREAGYPDERVDCAQVSGVQNVDLANPDADLVLFQAAVCAERADDLRSAAESYERVLAISRSKLEPRAMGRVGKIYARLERLGEAVDRLASYASRFAGERDARDAAADAIIFGAALGETSTRLDELACIFGDPLLRSRPELRCLATRASWNKCVRE